MNPYRVTYFIEIVIRISIVLWFVGYALGGFEPNGVTEAAHYGIFIGLGWALREWNDRKKMQHRFREQLNKGPMYYD